MRPSYRILHGGLRLMECVRLRVKDIDFAQRQLVVRDSKEMEDRVTMRPYSLATPLEEHLLQVKCLHASDLAQGRGLVDGNMSCPQPSCRKIRARVRYLAIR
jgi:integrase